LNVDLSFKENTVKTSRWRAAGVHLALSMGVALAVSLFIVFVWYPGPLFNSSGGKLLLALVIGVDMCIGPLATLVIFNPEKPRKLLVLDLTVIAILQVSALAYGLFATFEGRPVYVAYGQGYFVAVSANQLDEGMLNAAAHPEYKTLPVFGPRWVGTKEPSDPQEKSDMNFNLGMTGMGIHYLPKYYVGLADVESDMARLAKPIRQLRERHPEASAEIDRALARAGHVEADVGFIPLKARQKMLTVMVDSHSGKILDTLAIEPG
jgi:hypothetical protein